MDKTTKTTKRFKVQLITEGEGRWPYVGNGYLNKDGSINLYLDEGVTLTGGMKLRVREARRGAETCAEA